MFQVSSPSNIAFVKYWGKRDTSQTGDQDRNLPLNPSISLTLNKARTTTSFGKNSNSKSDFEVLMASKVASEKDYLKIQKHVERVLEFLNMSPDTRGYSVSTENNFPMGTGLASSASAFSALTLSVLGYFWGSEKLETELKTNAKAITSLARRGSGSACRSLGGPFVYWQNEAAETLAQKNWKLFDTIVIFSKTHKKVPSSEGHKSAQSSPLFGPRLEKIPNRLANVISAIERKNLQELGPLLECEANELHQIAQTGTPSITYAEPSTITFLNALRNYKNRDFYYTLDAGPNVHIISERPIEKEVNELLHITGLSAEIWKDESGTGPTF